MASSYKPVDTVEVRIWGKVVGAVARDPSRDYYAFEYDPRFVRQGIELAPLQMPLAQADRPFIFTNLPEPTYKRLPAMLADALPDDFGNALIDAWMASKGVPRDRITTIDRLAYMGKRGIGALEFKPQRGPGAKSNSALHMGNLVNAARKAVQGQIDNDAHAVAALKQIISVGTSAGGVRAKAAVAWNPQTDELRAGQFDVDEGFEHWLLKFDGVGEDKALGPSRDYGRIEYAYYRMATDAGIQMSPSRLLHENGRSHFMTRRFDREANKRFHVQSLCAMAHMDYKQKTTHSYNQLFDTMARLKLPHKDMVEAFRRMVFNVMGVNLDDHSKNFAFLLREGGAWELAPAYDVTHAYNPHGEWVHQHLMSVNGQFEGITRADIQQVAERFGLLGQVKPAIDQVVTALGKWGEYAREAGVDQVEVSSIAANIAKFSAEVAF